MTGSQDQTARDAQLLANLHEAIRREKAALEAWRKAELELQRSSQARQQASRARLAAEKALLEACE